MKLVEEALAREQRGQPMEIRSGPFLDGVEDIVGAGKGPPDLATNPKYIELQRGEAADVVQVRRGTLDIDVITVVSGEEDNLSQTRLTICFS